MDASGKKSVYAALIGNVLIALGKGIAAAVTGSSAMLAESFHSIVDCGNELLLLHGMRRSRLPPDEQFPFGHGKEIYFWTFVVAILIFSSGAGLAFYEGVHHLLHPAALAKPLVNYAVIAFAFLCEGLSWGVAVRELRKVKGARSYMAAIRQGKDPTLFAVVLEDSAALLGLLLALAGIGLSEASGNATWDGLASVLIGLLLAAVAILLARESKSLLIGESAGRDVVAGIRALIGRFPQVKRIHALLTMHIGPDFILANITLHVAPHLNRSQAHQLFDDIEAAIKRHYPRIRLVYIESDTPVPGVQHDPNQARDAESN